MGLIKDSITWANFVVVLQETIDEIKKSLSQHGKEIDNLRQQNLLLAEKIVSQSNHINQLEMRLNSIEQSLRVPLNNTVISSAKKTPRIPKISKEKGGNQ